MTYQELKAMSRQRAQACQADDVVLLTAGGQGCPPHVVRKVRLPKSLAAQLRRDWGTARRRRAERKLHKWAKNAGANRATFADNLGATHAEACYWDV